MYKLNILLIALSFNASVFAQDDYSDLLKEEANETVLDADYAKHKKNNSKVNNVELDELSYDEIMKLDLKAINAIKDGINHDF